MSEYANDRRWSDRYIPAIKQIVGPFLLQESSIEIDQKQAADLIVMRARDMAIACRVRRPGFLERYGWQFTIRSLRDSGAVTEMSKIVDGWGDWMFYAHATESETPSFTRWLLIDLHHFRAHLIRSHARLLCGRTANGDGTHFSWFDVRSFPPHPPLLIASSEPLPGKALMPAVAPAPTPAHPPASASEAAMESDFQIPGFTLPPQGRSPRPLKGTLQEPYNGQS